MKRSIGSNETLKRRRRECNEGIKGKKWKGRIEMKRKSDRDDKVKRDEELRTQKSRAEKEK